MLVLVLGLLVFLGIHSVRMVAPGLRAAQIGARGEGVWKGVYSVVSFVGLGLVIWGWSLARPNAPILYEPPQWTQHINGLIMLAALILLVASQVPGGKIKAAAKHPMLLAVKLWAFGHLLANGDLASVLLFGSFLAWAVWNRIAVKRRGTPDPVPGPVQNDLLAVVGGLVIYGLFIWKLHLWLFGVLPIQVA